MKHVPATHGTAEADVYGRSLQRHASRRRASREGHVHRPFIRSRKPSTRQRQETHRVRRRVESNLEARPRWPLFVRLDLRAFLERAVALLQRSTGIFDARMRGHAFLTKHYRLVLELSTPRNTTQAAGSRVAV